VFDVRVLRCQKLLIRSEVIKWAIMRLCVPMFRTENERTLTGSLERQTYAFATFPALIFKLLNLRFLLYLCSLDWLVIDWSVWLNRRLFYFNLFFVDLFSFSSCSWLWSWRLKAWRKWLWLCCRNYQRFRLLTFINRNLNGLLVAIDLMVSVLVSLAFTAQKVRLCTSEEVFTESARF